MDIITNPILSKVFKLLFVILGAAFGAMLNRVIWTLRIFNVGALSAISPYFPIISALIVIIFAIIFYFLSEKALKGFREVVAIVEAEIQNRTLEELFFGVLGLVIGLFLAFLISNPLYRLDIPYLGSILSILVYMTLGYLGIRVGTRKKDEFRGEVSGGSLLGGRFPLREKSKTKSKNQVPKILDTSVIIDGRISDICDAGFIEGPLIIPLFVLEELQHIADSADGLKRNRGRRGLDILKIMQDNTKLDIVINDSKYDDIDEVDSKLLKLTLDLKGKIITNDYNLNKVADVQGLEVLNINELANAVKPVVLPGEEMTIALVKDGKEHGQGLAYLDDGTMIVVESGKEFIGKTIDVIVTSVLQTSAGKMIFARPK